MRGMWTGVRRRAPWRPVVRSRERTSGLREALLRGYSSAPHPCVGIGFRTDSSVATISSGFFGGAVDMPQAPG